MIQVGLWLEVTDQGVMCPGCGKPMVVHPLKRVNHTVSVGCVDRDCLCGEGHTLIDISTGAVLFTDHVYGLNVSRTEIVRVYPSYEYVYQDGTLVPRGSVMSPMNEPKAAEKTPG